MAESLSEKLAYRLADMLAMLNAGESLKIDDLAEKYGVSIRTIQRDIGRLSFLDLVYENQEYRLHNRYFGSGLHFKDIRHFAYMSGVDNLYPQLNPAFLREIIQPQAEDIYEIKAHDFEKSLLFLNLMNDLKQAITAKYCVQFSYKDKTRMVEPYKLVHHFGCWYLAGVELGQIKTYHLSRMYNFFVTQQHFVLDERVLQEIEDDKSIWFGQQKIEVVIQVNTQVAQYFKQRQLLPEQNMVKEMVDGTLLLSCQIGHKLQLFPIVRWWIPYLKIVSPSEWQDELESGLKFYLENKLE